jgi:hypothetical protein
MRTVSWARIGRALLQPRRLFGDHVHEVLTLLGAAEDENGGQEDDRAA